MTKYFISYSRSDSDFVLKLAKELRDHNIDLWLDQLDIQAGQRWDRAIEKAMKECEGMLIFLSPTSTESENVLDEISYAIEEGKSVVPVLIKSCTIPYRLRRLQYANFTDQYDTGFAQLLNVLEKGIEVPNHGSVSVTIPDNQSPKEIPGQKPPAVASKRLDKPWLNWLISILVPASGWLVFEFSVIFLLNQNGVLTKFGDILIVDNWGVYATILNPLLVGVLARRDRIKNLLSMAAYALVALLSTQIAITIGDLFIIPIIYLAPVWGTVSGVIIQRFRAK